MFKQMKSALFWYYLYKFRKRVLLILLLLVISLFANAIYTDVVEYLQLKDKLQYLELALIIKWVVILFNVTLSLYLLLTLFNKEEKCNNQTKQPIQESPKEYQQKKTISKQTLSEREKSFLYKKNLRSKADSLLKK